MRRYISISVRYGSTPFHWFVFTTSTTPSHLWFLLHFSVSIGCHKPSLSLTLTVNKAYLLVFFYFYLARMSDRVTSRRHRRKWRLLLPVAFRFANGVLSREVETGRTRQIQASLRRSSVKRAYKGYFGYLRGKNFLKCAVNHLTIPTKVERWRCWWDCASWPCLWALCTLKVSGLSIEDTYSFQLYCWR